MSDQPAREVQVDNNIAAKWLPSHIREAFSVETSLPAVTAADRSAVLSVIEGETQSGESLVGEVIHLGHYVLHPVTLVDQITGEEVTAVRTILPQPDGGAVAFVSLGIIKSLGRIAWAVGKSPPYDPPLRVKLVSRGTGNGRRTYKLVPVEES